MTQIRIAENGAVPTVIIVTLHVFTVKLTWMKKCHVNKMRYSYEWYLSLMCALVGDLSVFAWNIYAN